MLGGVPSGTLEKLVHRWSAVEGFYGLAAGFVLKLAPPVFKPLDNAVPIASDFFSGSAGSVCRWDVGVVCFVFHVVDRGFQESFADAKDVMAQESDRAVAIVDGVSFQSLVGELANVALRGVENIDPLRHQLSGRKRYVPAALQADELGDVFQVLTEDELIAAG